MFNRPMNQSLNSFHKQRGAATILTGVLVLLMMTLMMLYGTRVGIFETRTSSNEQRSKQAFHASESAINHTLEYLSANKNVILSTAGGGWMEAGSERWIACSTVASPPVDHPCLQEPDATRRAASWFYQDPNDSSFFVDLNPANGAERKPDYFATEEDVQVGVVLCTLNIDASVSPPVVAGCDPTLNGLALMATVFSTGSADNGSAESYVKQVFADFNLLGGIPAPPLTARSNFPPTGTAEVVPNPDGGGVGVPISVWVNTRLATDPDCPAEGLAAIQPGSSAWATCEYHEWYEEEAIPSDAACNNTPCTCAVNPYDETISNTTGGVDKIGIDIVPDDQFPCDLWQFFFGLDRSLGEWMEVKSAATVVPDCSGLDANSKGLIWVSGAGTCTIGNGTIGSAADPVTLIVATDLRMNGGGEFFGILMATDVEKVTSVHASGSSTIYGAFIVDTEFDKNGYSGTVQIVYNEAVLRQAGNFGAFGALPGGWSDYQ